MSDPSHLLPPSLRGRYQDPTEVGRGGMGVVLRATDEELGRAVAIKLLLEVEFGGGSLRERFLEEGRICSRLQHPNLVRLFDFGVPPDGPPYMVFEFVEGESLEARLRRRPLSGPEALGVLIDIGRGLAHAHDAGVVHRDLKPENVLLDRAGTARVADFGLAKDPEGQVQTVQGMLVGTPPYMAPEYIRGKTPGPAADQYALGILAYQLLVGVVPFDHEDAGEILRMHVKAPVPDLRVVERRVPADLAQWIQRALAKTPEARFPHLQDLVAKLEAQREALGRALEGYRPDPGQRARAASTIAGAPIRGTVAGGRGAAPGEASSKPLVVGALGLVILAGFLAWLRRPTGVEVRDLQVRAAPASAEVTWRADGPSTLHLEAADGAPLGPPLAGPAGQAVVPLDGLEPSRSYAVSVRDAAGEVLQRVLFETPEASPIQAPRVEIPVDGGAPRVVLAMPYPVRLEVTGEVWDGGEWRPLEAAPAPPTEAHERVLTSVPLEAPARLWAVVRVPGSAADERFLLAENESLASVRLRQLLQPSSLSPEDLGAVLDELQDRLQAREPTPPDPAVVLVNHGVSPELVGLLRRCGELLRDDTVPLELRLQLERELRPLAGIDLTLVGFGHSPWLDLARLRRELLPFSTRTTLPESSTPLGPPWLPPEGKTSRMLMTDEFLGDMSPQSDLRLGVFHSVNKDELEQFEADGRRVRVDLRVTAPVSETTPVELWVTTRRMNPRHWFEVTIEDREPMVLWFPPEGDRMQVAGDENQLSCHRLPPGLVRRGPLTLSFRLATYPGEGGAVVPVSLARVELRGSGG